MVTSVPRQRLLAMAEAAAIRLRRPVLCPKKNFVAAPQVTQFSPSKLEDEEQPVPLHRLPSTAHVRQQCSRLQRNLCRFRPSLKVINESGYERPPVASSSSSSSPLFVLRWRVWEEGITLLFSNGGWQANYFLDHTKIIVFGRSGVVCTPRGPANGRSVNSTLWFADISDWFHSHPQHGLQLARPLSNFI
ncbi:unnamed protein product [Dibothriocephalus latus]|uniref:Uncharacterized protein n=1 Tax=Dibothriocephalus latus TaxID=60516 RepID=A0A3P7PCB5_DIBLA|nr:unnamed protein product [Dibothriocephalus latus]